MNNLPKNHHYVSQCLVKKFFIDNKLYCFNKKIQKITTTNSSKRILSEIYSNCFIKESGEVDYDTIEKDLNKLFENDFNKNILSIEKILEQVNISDRKKLHLKNFLFKMIPVGLSNLIRNPSEKTQIDKSLNSFYNIIENYGDDRLKKELLPNKNENVIHENHVIPSEMCNIAIKNMGDIYYDIYIIDNEKDFFILPDNISIIERYNINNINPEVKEISIVEFPLTNKIYFSCHSNKLSIRNFYEKDVNIHLAKKEDVLRINIELIKNSINYFYCSDKRYLEKLIKYFSFFEDKKIYK